MKRSLSRAAVVGLLLFASAPVLAQSVEDRLRDQLRQVTLQLRQALDENADLKNKLDTQTQQLTAQQAQAESAQAKAQAEQSAALQQQLAAQTSQAAAAQQQLDATRQALAQWQKAYQDAAVIAKARTADLKTLQAKFDDTDGQLKTCSADNAQLVEISNDILQRYKNKGLWSTIADREPVTGLHRVELEKAAQEYHGRIVDATMTPPAAPATTPH